MLLVVTTVRMVMAVSNIQCIFKLYFSKVLGWNLVVGCIATVVPCYGAISNA
ncbi:Putative aminotransferase class III superfamily protein, partial [Zea mays]